jgi:hypothetical protein
MPVALSDFRHALGERAVGLSDDELQSKLDYMDRLADVAYAWWEKRRGTAIDTATGHFYMDVQKYTPDEGRLKRREARLKKSTGAAQKKAVQSKNYENPDGPRV